MPPRSYVSWFCRVFLGSAVSRDRVLDPSGLADRLERLRGSPERQRPTGDARRMPGFAFLLSRSQRRSRFDRRYRGLRERPGSSVVAVVKSMVGRAVRVGGGAVAQWSPGSRAAQTRSFCAAVDPLSSYWIYISSITSSNGQASSRSNIADHRFAYSRICRAARSTFLLRPRCPR